MKDGVYKICSRNYVVEEDEKSPHSYTRISKELDIEAKLRSLGQNIGIQGEICGPKINTGRTLVKEMTFSVFNIYSIDDSRYLMHEEVETICKQLGFQMVPLIYKGNARDLFASTGAPFDKSSFLSMSASLEYQKGFPAEGMVVKTNDNGERISFKVISNKYLLKYDL